MSQKKPTPAEDCLERVNSAINHVRNFAPDCPLERFLAQEIAIAKAEAFEEAGWHLVAEAWRRTADVLGEEQISTQLALRDLEGKAAPVGGEA